VIGGSTKQDPPYDRVLFFEPGCQYPDPLMAQQPPPAEIADLLKEDRTFAPSETFRSRATIRDEDIYARAERDPEAFWAGFAEELQWFSKCTHVLNW